MKISQKINTEHSISWAFKVFHHWLQFQEDQTRNQTETSLRYFEMDYAKG